MFDINHCRLCGNLMTKQIGWVGENMIEYEVCIGCRNIEILSEGLTLEQAKEIELQKGYK